MPEEKIKRAERMTDKAYDVTYKAARTSSGLKKKKLTNAMMDLEKAKTEIEESEEI